jgi:hypothetical protein
MARSGLRCNLQGTQASAFNASPMLKTSIKLPKQTKNSLKMRFLCRNLNFQEKTAGNIVPNGLLSQIQALTRFFRCRT